MELHGTKPNDYESLVNFWSSRCRHYYHWHQFRLVRHGDLQRDGRKHRELESDKHLGDGAKRRKERECGGKHQRTKLQWLAFYCDIHASFYLGRHRRGSCGSGGNCKFRKRYL